MMPVYFTAYDYGDGKALFLRPILLSFYNALRMFILESDYAELRDMVRGVSEWHHAFYMLYIALLSVIAPILTFTSVLSLFKNFRGMMRFALSRKKKIFIMSELNEKSLILAKSIKSDPRFTNALIVFTDVFPKEEEREYEMLGEAKKLDAICLKMDVTQLNIYSKKADIEVFLIGSDESENVEQAIRITTDLNEKNDKENVKLFVFTVKESNGYILDSVRYDNLLERAAQKGFGEGTFKLRRIDKIRQVVWNTLPDMHVFDLAQKKNKTLSVLILGMGLYGIEFFKALIWYCQFEGYKLKMTIVDNRTEGTDGKKGIRSAIEHRFPDLLRYNRSEVDGDAYYDVEIIEGVDMSGSVFDSLAVYDGVDEKLNLLARRIKSTDIAIVSLGDDEMNIDTSIGLRTLFDRIHGFNAKETTNIEDEKVQIYSVVYNERKSGLLHNAGTEDSGFLINHSNIPYNIHFIGSMTSQFKYDSIYDPALEAAAKMHHLGWVDVEAKISEKTQKDGGAPVSRLKTKNEERFEHFEYYRLSSIAKELHRRAIVSNEELRSQTVCNKGGGENCRCEKCLKAKKSEHRRWNAYTRLLGFVYLKNEKRVRAMQHNSLTGWEDLTDDNKRKA